MLEKLWEPSQQIIEAANVTRFIAEVNQQHQTHLSHFVDLYQWSIDYPELFWQALWRFANVIGDRGEQVLEHKDRMLDARWFADSSLNFAENLLRHADDKPDQVALIFWGEDKIKRELSQAQLKQQVASLSQFLRDEGVSVGDVVAGYLPNVPEAVVAMLATASIGAIWTSCSPDFGVQGVLDRFGQVKPKVLISANAYYYNGKTHDGLEKLKAIIKGLDSLQQVVVVSYAEGGSRLADSVSYQTIISRQASELIFTRLPFNSPLYILYSSGTTGIPKCIVHGIGGTLLQQLKEQLLHVNLKPKDRIFYFTTCGWMMWNWLVSALATGATLMLYDGSPFYPSDAVLLDFVEQENITVLGVSAKYLDVLRKKTAIFTKTHTLKSLKTILSTGSVLCPEGFDYVYQSIKKDVRLSSISGGTDIISCFALGSPTLPVYRGELQSKGLGMQVEVWNASAEPINNEKGELVCVKSFPSMPICFWNDLDQKKYHQAYFKKFDNVWCHGDYVMQTDRGGLVFYGRSDTVLNPGGVRIGTAEIYRQVEQLDSVQESIVIGQSWQDDVRIILFVRLSEGIHLDEVLIQIIKSHIRHHSSPRHVPAKVLQVSDIPRTKSGKIVELAVRDAVQGEAVKNIESLANPEALQEYRNRKELQS